MSFDPITVSLMKKQLPCYDTRKNFVIETGLQGITPTKIDGFDYYRISDYVPTWDKFIAGTIEISLSGNHAEMPISACSPAWINGFYTTNLYIGVDTDGVRTPKGTYFIAEEGTLDQEILEGVWIKITFPQSGELKTLDPKYFGKVINFDNYYFTTSMFPDVPMSLTMIVGFLMGNGAGDNSCLLTNEMAKQLAKELNEDDDIVAQFSTDNNMYTKVRNCKVTVIKDESGKTRRVHGFIFPMNMSDGANVNYTIIFMPFEDDTVHIEVVR